MRLRTGYSFRNAVGSLEAVMQRIKAAGYKAAPISDRASTFGWVRWKKLAEKEGLLPIFGVELAVTDSINAPRPTSDHWTFFAMDDIAEINRLITLATSQFRYEPLLTYDQANAATGVMKIVGHRSNLTLVEKGPATFVALSPSSSKGYIKQADELGLPLIASSDNRYPDPEWEALFEIIVGNAGQTYDQFILDESQWRAAVEGKVDQEGIDAAWRVSQRWLGKKSWATLRQAKLLSPAHKKSLQQMCVAGAKKLGCDLKDPVYKARLKKELDLIAAKNFEDYFYIIADIVQWARERMIVGPARGSSCGSLVCYLLEITTIDPIPFDLIFERFIDINRSDLPDIDIDFSDQKRQLVFDYMAEKYGAEHVARLGTVAMYQPRSAVAEAGASLGVPKWKCDAALDSLIERSSGDSRALNTLEDTLNTTPAGQELVKAHPEIMIAAKMEGHPKHNAQHAAGMVITEEPVTNFVAVDARTGATYCDKKDAEELNLLKIDALGLTQLSVFEDALELAGLDRLHLETLPLDDPEAFEVLNKGQFAGIFQFMGLALQGLVNQIKVDDIEDIISITALARPGALTSGGAAKWVKRKRGDEPVTYPHPAFAPYMQNTMGVVMYQEQILQIGREVGDLTWGEVTELRKAMSKSLGKEYFDKFGDKFKKGAARFKIPPDILDKVWDDLCAYGAWSFNRSHSVAYGVVSYWCCWLKAHYPLEFAAATLTHMDKPENQIALLRELDKEGIGYLPVDAELSTDKWTVGLKDGAKRLIGPVQNVKGIGPKLMQQILSCRARGEPLPPKAEKLLSDPVTPLDSLWPIRDAFERIMPDPKARSIFTEPTPIDELVTKGFKYEALVFVVIRKINPRDENEVINVVKRGGVVYTDKTQSLNLQIADDTGTLFAKVGRYDYDRIGKQIVDRGAPGRALYALKGNVPEDFAMLSVKKIKFIGMLNDEAAELLEEPEVPTGHTTDGGN